MYSASKSGLAGLLSIAVVLVASSASAYELTQADRDFLAKKIIARCAVTQPGQIEGLYGLGIDILEDYPDWRKGSVTILVDADEFEELEGVGFTLDVITDDWYRSYAAKTPQAMGGFQTFYEIAGELLYHSVRYSDIASLFSIGQSIEGREQWVLKISDNPEIDEDEPEVFFTGMHHANEPIGAALLMGTIRRFLDGYGSDTLRTRLVDEREIFFLPVVNPDGYVYNEMIAPDGGGLWRKNRNPQFDPDFGVDLNRNYGYMWGLTQVTGYPDLPVYRGTAPFSEPETANIRAFVNSREFVLAEDYHAYGDFVAFPWFSNALPAFDHPLFQMIGDSMATFNGYEAWTALSCFLGGVAPDWWYGATDEHGKILSFGREVGHAFWPDPSDIVGLIEENQEPILLLLKLADDPERILAEAVPEMTWNLSSDFECEYHAAPGGTEYERLTIGNTTYGRGPGTLQGGVTVTEGGDWLSVVPDVWFSLDKGDPDVIADVIMDAAGLAEGLYWGNIQITHNDPSQPSPVDVPVEFFVFSEFNCPQAQVLRTGVASPGILSLEVSSNGRFGSQNSEGGMWRYLDSSSTVFDASLVLAHGTQNPDTVVFHRFYSRNDPGQNGWRPRGDLVIDTSAYGTGMGEPNAYATAIAGMTTADSVIDVDAEWFFPQDPTYADFVIAKYTVSNRTATPVTDIVIGLWLDFNVRAARHVLFRYPTTGQYGNQGNFVSAQNLIYQYGSDSIGITLVDDLHSCQRYSGGVSYLVGRDASGTPFELAPATLRAGIDDNWLNQDGGGPTSGLMYRTLTGPPGVTVWEPDPEPDWHKDLFTWLTLDQGRTLEPNGANPEVYVVAFMSDTLAHDAFPLSGKTASANLGEVVDSAWAWAERVVMCNCPCHADPQCDGVTNVLDVVHSVNVAFRSSPPVFDDNCPFEQTDVDCSGFTNVIDVVKFVNVAFRGGLPAVNFCEPCL
ncbi:MAG TPA: M14 family metallopeptidase [Acidobacteriota bacterium]|nr:M14 family metallopeptidase [Acidobacteriota bacterium]